MTSNYIDIDSSYRDRVKDQLPAQFTVKLTNPDLVNGLSAFAPISNQIILYPPQTPIGSSQLQLEPVAFFDDAGTVTERLYLPYMFSLPNSTTTLFLDSLPIAPTTESPLTIEPTTDLGRSVIPLGRADNFYIGKYIENVTTGETREIVGFQYDATPTFLQSVVVNSYTLETSDVFVEISTPANGSPPSNVDRFYQGKTIEFADGEERVIVNYFVNDVGRFIVQLDSPLPNIPTMGSEASIIAPETWTVKINEAFSSPVSPYPAYESGVTGLLNLTVNTKTAIETDNKVLAIDGVEHADGSLGIVYQTYRTLNYIYSNAARTSWTSVEIANLNSVDDEYSYSNAQNHGISVTLIDGRPAIAYVEGYTNENNLLYVRADTANGSAWTNTPANILSSAYPAAPYINRFGKVIIKPQPDIEGGTAGLPQIAFTDLDTRGGYATYIKADGGTFDAPTWTTAPPAFLDVAGYMIDMDFYLNTSATNYNAGTNLDRTFIFFRRDSDGYPVYWRQDTAGTGWVEGASTPTVLQESAMNQYGSLLNVQFDVPSGGFRSSDRVVSALTVLWQETSSGDVLTSTMSLQDDLTGVSTGSIRMTLSDDTASPPEQREPIITVRENFTNGTNELRGVYTGASSAFDVAYLTGTAFNNIVTIDDDGVVQETRENVNTFQLEPVFGIDHSFGVDTYAQIATTGTTLTYGSYIIYQITDNTIYILSTNVIESETGQQYRIRINDPQLSGNIILGGSTTTIQLPTTASTTDNAYVGDYIMVQNRVTDPVPATFSMINDYRQIKEYDGTTRTATVTVPFSVDLNQAVLTDGNLISWEILSFERDSYHPLVYVGSNVSQQEQVCYRIELISLILPNITLGVGEGNRIAFYPYVYVEFAPINSPYTNSFYSNNPNATKILFKVPITNIVSPDRATFVTLSGRGMVQTVKFLPNQVFKFTVYLPNGEIFQTLETDTTPPFPPNPNLQVSAMFGITRV